MGINISDFANVLNAELEKYAHAVKEDVDVLAETVAKDGAEELKTTSPVGATGDYRKGWSIKKDKSGKCIIYNKKYQLTHLLENGHAKVSGGRVPGQPHIGPVEQEVIKKFEDGIKMVVQQ